MTDFDTQYDMLNAEQKKAVDTIEGPVIVVAGPGTGKTQILTLRIANILKSAGTGTEPENILALTFTNAGVVAMRERLATFIGAEEAYRTNIFTFHSFCEDQIKQYSDYFPEITFSRVATDIEKIHILEKILTENKFEFLTTFNSDFHYIKDILYAIDELKREGVDPEEFSRRIEDQKNAVLNDPDSYYKRNTKKNKKGELKELKLKPLHKNRDLCEVYALYQDELKKNKLYDFTDMIMQFAVVAENNEEFGSILREQYRYILVDEHQDTNDGQNRIIDVLTSVEDFGGSPNLFTVGDDKQAIYRFQGADIKNFLHFGKRFDDAVIINLKNNYRSAQGILDEAHTLIMSGEEDTHEELSAFKNDEARICVKRFPDYKDELVHIADDILSKIGSGIAPEEIAVFYREHNNLPFVKEVFEKRGVPYVVVARQNILEDVLMQKFITFLRVVFNPRDNREFSKLLLLDIVDIDIDDALAILDHFGHVSRKKNLYQFLSDEKDLVRYGVVEIKKVRTLVQFIKKQKELSENMYVVEFFEQFVRESHFFEHILEQKDHIFLLQKLSRLLDEVREMVVEKKNYGLQDFIQHLDIYKHYNLSMSVERSVDSRGVNLMTAHGSKGLEFEHVYITNVVNGLWGGKKNIRKFALPINVFSGDIEDERRLFYVAITRAKSNLTISYADHDMGGREKLPSLFISDLSVTQVDIEDEKSDGYGIFFAPRMRMMSSLISHEYIRDKFFSTQLSATALNNYFSSPLLYFFRNLVCLPSVQNKTLLHGSILHAALEGYFKKSYERGEFLSKEELLQIFDVSMDQSRVPYEYFDSIEKSGHDVLSGYYDQYKNDFILDVELEKKIKAVPFVLDSGEEILLTGVIDKIVHNKDGTISVVDYKSGKSWSKCDKKKKESLRRQVVFYKLLLDSYDNGKYKMVTGELDFIEPNSDTHEYEKEIISVNESDVVRIKKEINVFAKDVSTGAFLDNVIEKKWGDSSMDEYIALLNMLKKRYM